MTVASPSITADQHLRTDHLKSDLRRRSVRGGAVTLLVQASKFLLRSASTVVLARLLTPTDYGLVSMAAAVIGFAGIFKDMGLSAAIIQRHEISDEQVSSLFWINVFVSLTVTCVTAACGPLLAWFYAEPRVALLTAVLATTFFLGGLSVQHQALLARQMRFFALGIIDIVSMTFGIAVAVAMARSHCGYWSLVGMAIATEASDIVLAWTLCRWRPRRPALGRGVGAIVRFGGNVTLSNTCTYLSRNADNFLIGWYWGPIALGLYARAYQLFMLPLQQLLTPLTSIVLPALSRLQDQPERFRRYFITVTSSVNAVSMPMAATMAVLSAETVRVALGGQWMGAVSILRVLCIGAVFQPVSSSGGWLYLSTGRTRALLKWTSISTTVHLLSFAIGLPFGAYGVALSYTVARLLLLVPLISAACAGTPVTRLDIARSAAQPLCASAAAVFVALCTRRASYGCGLSMWQVFILAGSSAMLAAIVVMAFCFRNLAFYARVWAELRPRAPAT